MMNDNFIFYSGILKDIPKEDISFINSMPKDMIFKCFSLNLYKKLISRGFYPACKALYPKKNLIYTTFLKSEELMKVVTEFSEDTTSKSEYRIKKYGKDISYEERQKLKKEGEDIEC